MSAAHSSAFSAYEGKGLTGLGNVGNTCYLNACVQILSHTYELSDYLEKQTYAKKINKIPESVLLVEWDKLRKLMWSDNCTIAPWGFVKAVQKVAASKGRDLFTGHAQNDVQEFLLFLVDGFHMALAREVDMEVTGTAINETDKLAQSCYGMMKNMYRKEFSEMLGIFYGIHVSEITSMESGDILSLTPEPFSVVSLSIPEGKRNPSLLDCFDQYCAKENLEGNNAWFNDETNQSEDAQRGIVYWSLPEVLIIDLKRWTESGSKINKLVSVPLEGLDLSKYVKGYNKNRYVYDLYGTCNHSGGSLGGHYTANVKNANGQWYSFNDTHVDPIDTNRVVSPSSYCLFFRKIK